ncbi:DUF3500 domain-containing protein [Steroidobacter cummioxidans]|uniref:DUF3500 domain-containing protein n=1 Tax=Steroidobacter cummioxidans TaxID=1803913 RepID=UPI000E30B46A|nr:DUF3500 domain-containing protein [Steroidobacter cummioxidans]
MANGPTMKRLKPGALIGAVVIFVSLGAALMSSRANEPDKSDDKGASGTAAARAVLQSLPEAKRTRANVSFDSSERTNWNYVPGRRAGVALKELDANQKALIDPLLRSALSPAGFATAQQIVQHESILAEIEGNPRRDPELYYTAVFGEPGPRAPWAWRFEGHHLSVNVTHVDGQTQVVAPLFMGSNPARVPRGPKAGLRLLAAEEDLARDLIRMLPEERRTRAILAKDAFSDIVTRNDPKVSSLNMEGLAARDMSETEQTQLRKLLHVYSDRMTESAARDQLERIERAGFDKLHFGWAGSIEPGKPHYYRVHGPTVLIEYDNTQNNANHIHSVWRDLERDFGGDLLRAHYEAHQTDGHGHGHEH